MKSGMIACCTAMLGLAGAVEAHHSFAAHFAAEQTVTVSGTVTDFRFRNPHGLVFFSVRADDGSAQLWKAETNAPSVLRRRGWSESSIAAGDRVTVEGYPARHDPHYLRIYRVIYEDGRELIGQRPVEAAAGADD